MSNHALNITLLMVIYIFMENLKFSNKSQVMMHLILQTKNI